MKLSSIKQICPDFIPEEPGPHLVQFLSCKWPPPISAHQVFAFWVRSLTGHSTVIVSIYISTWQKSCMHLPTYKEPNFITWTIYILTALHFALFNTTIYLPAQTPNMITLNSTANKKQLKSNHKICRIKIF